ncbi:MAG: phage baseplate assembly protein V [Agriterribacter sp.]
MAQFVEADIDIDGKKIKQYTSFVLHQSIFEHHSFRLVCPAEAIDGTSGAILHSSKNMIGSSITIKIDAIGNKGTLQFSGVVTQVEAARHSGHAGDIIISGFSPTILLDNGPHCKSWESQGIKNIAQDVLKHFPKNLLQPKINPAYTEALAYTVQYKETAWQFLSRIAATYGEWLFYDGQKLYLGAPSGKKEKLLYGSTLNEFNMALQVRPASFQMMAYDYINSDVYGGTPSGIAGKAGLNDLGKHALQKSEKFYSSKPKLWHNHFLTSKKQLDDVMNAKAAMQSSNMVKFNGSSGQPAVHVGGGVSVDGKNVFSQSDESFGDYTVIAVTHYCDGQGNYYNDFTSIPASVKMPPVTGYTEPRCETQSAVVTDNHDPKGLGQVRVKFHWMNGGEKSPWMRFTTPHAGGGKGMFFIPEKDEEVIVGFEGDSPTKPYVIGSVYHGKANNSFSNAENDVKTIQSRSGHIIEMNDKKGSETITVKDKNNNTIHIDTPKGCITVKDKANNHIIIDASGNTITIKDKNKNNITMNSSDNSIGIKALGSITLAAMNINLIAGAMVNVQATASYNLNTMNSMTNVSKNTILRTKELSNFVKNSLSSTATTINQTAKKDINTKAKEKITVSAKNKLDQRAGEMEVATGTGKLTLTSAGNAEIKGTQVKIN